MEAVIWCVMMPISCQDAIRPCKPMHSPVVSVVVLGTTNLNRTFLNDGVILEKLQ